MTFLIMDDYFIAVVLFDISECDALHFNLKIHISFLLFDIPRKYNIMNYLLTLKVGYIEDLKRKQRGDLGFS